MSEAIQVYNTKELWDLAMSTSCGNPLKVFIPDCDMWNYFVREIYVSGAGGNSADEEIIFMLSGNNGFECEKYADQIHKTADSAQIAADNEQKKLEYKFGGKDGLNRMRLRLYETIRKFDM